MTRRWIQARWREVVYDLAGRLCGDRTAYYRFDDGRASFIVQVVWVRCGPVRFIDRPCWFPSEEISERFDAHVREIVPFRGDSLPPINFIETPEAVALALRDGLLRRIG